MAYKDKNKQREANAERQRRYKARHKGVTSKGVTFNNDGSVTVPDKLRFNVGEVSKPILLDVHPMKPKRGKDIKCFADLHPGIQQTIDKMSMVDGKTDHADRTKRIHAAKKYQHLFPDRYEPHGAEYSVSAGGVACGCEPSQERKGAL